MVKVAVETFGRLDAAVNNAGIGGPQALTAEYPIDEWSRVIAVNLTGPFLSMRSEIPAMLDPEAVPS
jgi:NAD(P)-dependent dehydrogenase (short-subunit alcohol dehydrogenase family)